MSYISCTSYLIVLLTGIVAVLMIVLPERDKGNVKLVLKQGAVLKNLLEA